MRTLAIDQVSAEVVTAFTAAGIPSILLKGPSIAAWLYPTGGRGYCDTDLLVPGPLFQRAGEVLRELRFSSDSEHFSAFERDHATELTFVRRGRGPSAPSHVIDLHRSLHGLASSDDFVWATLGNDPDTLSVGGADVRVLNRVALALHIVLHAVHHQFSFHTGEDLRRVVTACTLDDWAATAELARRLDIEDVLGFGLRHEVAGAAVADELQLRVMAIEDSPDAWNVSRGLNTLGQLSSAGSRVEQTRCIRWTVFPTRARIASGCGPVEPSRTELARMYLRRWHDITVMVVPASRRALAQRRNRMATSTSNEPVA